MNLDHHKKQAKLQQNIHKKYLETLKKKAPKDIDYITESIHEEVFREIDCLTCAQCCKTTGPLFTEKDIERIAKHLRMKPSQFEEKYLKIDEDGDKILQSVPCIFLGEDHYCSIYSVRPKACKEYPHTDRKKILQINHLTLQNTQICPAAYIFVEKMMEKIPLKK